jgi:hypothetical protein
MDKRKHPRFSIRLPLQYWETHDSSKGGLVGNVSETGLLIYSIEDMRIGIELKVKVYFSLGDDFKSFEAFAKINWKEMHFESDWKGYKYGLEVIQISMEDQENLRELLMFLQSKRALFHKSREAAGVGRAANIRTSFPLN